MTDACHKEAHEIVKEVYDEYKTLPIKLARLTGKSPECFYQHGREPRSTNPLQTGSPSPATHFQRQCREFEAVERGAGRMLSNRIHAALDQEFAENDLITTTQQDIHIGIIKETGDVLIDLTQIDLATATRNELWAFDRNCQEAMEVIDEARGKARVRLRELQARVKEFNGVSK